MYLNRISGRIEGVDAVILMGVDYQTAINRRKTARKAENSKTVNPTCWPLVNEGYSWWLSKLYPILRRTYGTGVLVLSSDEDFEINLAKTEAFVGQVMDQCEGKD